MGTFHLMFLVSLQVVGASPRAMPVSYGPRHRGQSASPRGVFPIDAALMLASDSRADKNNGLVFMRQQLLLSSSLIVFQGCCGRGLCPRPPTLIRSQRGFPVWR